MLGNKIQGYLDRMTARARPRAIVIRMIYYPLEYGLGQQSRADTRLKALGYNTWLGQLQTARYIVWDNNTQDKE